MSMRQPLLGLGCQVHWLTSWPGIDIMTVGVQDEAEVENLEGRWSGGPLLYLTPLTHGMFA